MNIYNKYNHIFLYNFIFLFQLKFFQINSELLNRVIRLGDNPYRYIHFSLNSQGDMIIAYPTTKDRRFYGIQ